MEPTQGRWARRQRPHEQRPNLPLLASGRAFRVTGTCVRVMADSESSFGRLCCVASIYSRVPRFKPVGGGGGCNRPRAACSRQRAPCNGPQTTGNRRDWPRASNAAGRTCRPKGPCDVPPRDTGDTCKVTRACFFILLWATAALEAAFGQKLSTLLAGQGSRPNPSARVCVLVSCACDDVAAVV
jgi:hypothetical protein